MMHWLSRCAVSRTLSGASFSSRCACRSYAFLGLAAGKPCTSTPLLNKCLSPYLVPCATLRGGVRPAISLRDYRSHWEDIARLDEMPQNQYSAAGVTYEEVESLLPTVETHEQLFNGIKYKDLPIIHVKVSKNNGILSLTEAHGPQTMLYTSSGVLGFRNARKKSSISFNAAGMDCGMKALKLGHKTVRVAIRGVGRGREATITGLQMAGLDIISITDVTPLNEFGPRPKRRRKI